MRFGFSMWYFLLRLGLRFFAELLGIEIRFFKMNEFLWQVNLIQTLCIKQGFGFGIKRTNLTDLRVARWSACNVLLQFSGGGK